MSFVELDTTQQLAYALQLALGAVFLLAAVPKLRAPAAFVRTVAGYGILPRAASRALAPALIAVECFLAAVFLSGYLSAVALPFAGATLLAFTAAAAINLRRGRRVPCGCFGAASEPISGRSLARLAALLAVVAALAALPASATTLGVLADDPLTGLAAVVVSGGIAAFLLLAATWLLNLQALVHTLRQLEVPFT